MTDKNSQLDRDYEQAKSRNDWQGMAAAHALRMRNRDTEKEIQHELTGAFIGSMCLFALACILVWLYVHYW